MSVRYRKNPETAGRVIDGLAFIITPDDNRLHTLNATATQIWQLSEDGFTEAEAARALATRFEVDEPTALADVRVCLADLVSRQILLAE
jgi:hypothetical protein